MLRLSKKVEYALIAMQYIATRSDKVVATKEIAEQYDLSFDFLSKTLQLLARQGFIESQKGIRGGYVLAKNPVSISVADIVNTVEGRQEIVPCNGAEDCTCKMYTKCEIKNPMHKLQESIDNVFSSMTISQMI